MDFAHRQLLILRVLCAATLTVAWAVAFTANTRADTLSLELARGDRIPERVVSLQQMQARVGDYLKIQSELGEEYRVKIDRVSRSNLGNKIIAGRTDAGARLTMVLSSLGGLQGSLREGSRTYRLAQEGDQIVWHEAVPYLARPADQGAIIKQRSEVMTWSPQRFQPRQLMQPRALMDLSDEQVTYPTYSSGRATIDLLIYHESGMDTPTAIADFVIELTNQAMADSQIDLTVNIVGVRPVEILASVSQGDALDKMYRAEAPFTDIESDRSFYGADLVVLLRENVPEDESACGVAYNSVVDGAPFRFAYMAVVHWLPVDNAIGNDYCTDTTAAHEIGHILGSMHERRIAEKDDRGAYPFSFGHYRQGVFHTIMSYGNEPEIAVFSNPNINDCAGQACGLAEDDPESADNARGFNQTRFMLAGYESEHIASELITDFAVDETCVLEGGGSGRRKGHGIANDSPHSIDIRAFSVLTNSSSVLTETFEPGENQLTSGLALEPKCQDANTASSFGSDYRESWVTYQDSTSGKLVESVHLRWDDNFEGNYAQVRIAGASNGSVTGQTARLVKPDESLSVVFSPAAGFRLAEVTGSCQGSLQGDHFTLLPTAVDCLIEPTFSPMLSTGKTLRVLLEEPVINSVYSGIGNLRGWAVASDGIEKIEIWIDGVYAFDTPYGGARGDVGNAFPEIVGASDSGFSLAWNYNNMTIGAHTITARAYDRSGQSVDSTSAFTVARFEKPFLKADDQVSLADAQCSLSDSRISLQNALMDGKFYDILLDWRTATQGFEMIEIR